MTAKQLPNPETPDVDTPDWTDANFRWAVHARDFDGNVFAVTAFLKSRAEFLAKAEAAGIPRDTFLPFDPNRPGFEERAKALLKLADAVGWAAE